ncbi:hypothetical protein QVD99_000283 [Batrachochytrium dendrobatidis]|nr:hypothetical protein QVD99_000283 [Batrachochytrium dendrobatidis]
MPLFSQKQPQSQPASSMTLNRRKNLHLPLEIISCIGILSSNPHLSTINRAFYQVASNNHYRAKWLLYRYSQAEAMAMMWNYKFMHCVNGKCGCKCDKVAVRASQYQTQSNHQWPFSWNALCNLAQFTCQKESFLQISELVQPLHDAAHQHLDTRPTIPIPQKPQTASICPLEKYQMELLSCLAYYGGDISSVYNLTLCMAVQYGHLNLVALVLLLGANPEARIGRHRLSTARISPYKSALALKEATYKLNLFFESKQMLPHYNLRQKQFSRYRHNQYFRDSGSAPPSLNPQNSQHIVPYHFILAEQSHINIAVIGNTFDWNTTTTHALDNSNQNHETSQNLDSLVSENDANSFRAFTTVPDEVNLENPNALFRVGVASLFPDDSWEYDADILRSIFYQAVFSHHIPLIRILLGLDTTILDETRQRLQSQNSWFKTKIKRGKVSYKTLSAALSCALAQNHIDIANILIKEAGVSASIEMVQSIITRAGIWRVCLGNRSRFANHLKLCIQSLNETDFQRTAAHMLKSSIELGVPGAAEAIISRCVKNEEMHRLTYPFTSTPGVSVSSLEQTSADLINAWNGLPLYASVYSGNPEATAYLLSFPSIRVSTFTVKRLRHCLWVLGIEMFVFVLFMVLVCMLGYWIGITLQAGDDSIAMNRQGSSLAQLGGMALVSLLAIFIMYRFVPFHRIVKALLLIYHFQKNYDGAEVNHNVP